MLRRVTQRASVFPTQQDERINIAALHVCLLPPLAIAARLWCSSFPPGGAGRRRLTNRTPPDTSLSLWHGLAANWQSRVARHLIDSTRATFQEGFALHRELSEARTLTDVAAAHGASARRLMAAFVDQTNSLSDLGVSMGKEFAASMTPATDAIPPPAE